jgi:hypothetical protein
MDEKGNEIVEEIMVEKDPFDLMIEEDIRSVHLFLLFKNSFEIGKFFKQPGIHKFN